jgi:hypothetical protein
MRVVAMGYVGIESRRWRSVLPQLLAIIPMLTLLSLDIAYSTAHGQVATADLKVLADTHRWAELRNEAAKNENAIFYRAIAAAIFNEPEAEALFKSAIHNNPTSEEAYESYDWLANLYLKSGRYQSLTATMEARWTTFPNKKGVASEKKGLTPFRGLPDQKNGSRRVSMLHHDAQSFSVSLTINHKQVKFFFDDGADVSCISEKEAKRLGMKVRDAAGSMGSMTKDSSFRMATAHRVTIGAMHFKDVSFAVFPDDQEPMSLVPLGERGIIGLPLMIATGTFHWKSDGTLILGEEPNPLNALQANLFFESGKRPVLKAAFLGQDIWTALDSGAMTTDIYAPFAQRFSGYLKENGKIGRNEIRGMGGAETFDSIDVPDLALKIGGREVTLRPAHILTKRTERRDWILANVGKDLLTQTSGFTIDFRAMTLTLE